MSISEDALIKAVVHALDHAEMQVFFDVLRAIERAINVESKQERESSSRQSTNAKLAADKRTPMCQDTGVPTFT